MKRERERERERRGWRVSLFLLFFLANGEKVKMTNVEREEGWWFGFFFFFFGEAKEEDERIKGILGIFA
ncbi:hypothetical protein LguiA_026939 [Lonicera macranthoides]